MLIRIVADLAFKTKPPADGLLPFLRDAFNHAVAINPGTPNYEETYIEVQECFHDEDPLKPCNILARYTVV